MAVSWKRGGGKEGGRKRGIEGGNIHHISDVAATIFFAPRLGAAIIQGWCLFLWKPADIKDGWIKYIQPIQ